MRLYSERYMYICTGYVPNAKFRVIGTAHCTCTCTSSGKVNANGNSFNTFHATDIFQNKCVLY